MTHKTKKTLRQFIRNLRCLIPLTLSMTLFIILVCTSITINPLLGLLIVFSPVLTQLAYFLLKALWCMAEVEVEIAELEKARRLNDEK